VTITFRNFDGPYNDKFAALPSNLQNKNIKNFIDLSSSRVDYYNLRALMNVETGYRFDISLTQVLYNGFTGFATEERKNNFFLNNKSANTELNNPKYSPLYNENLERNLDTPVMFLISEESEFLNTKEVSDYFNIEIDTPLSEIDISYIDKNDILSETNIENVPLQLFFNELKNPQLNGNFNRIIDENFYEHQFQKDLYNKNAIKLCGLKSLLTSDFKHNGSWEILKYPYNGYDKQDTICSYPNMTLNSSITNLYGENIVNGPLSYYQIDISYTNEILSDYPKRQNTSVNSRFSSLRIRKVNPNYKYTEGSTENSRQQFLNTGNQYITHQVYSKYDISFGQPENINNMEMIDYVI
jgi:hypothetical protein